MKVVLFGYGEMGRETEKICKRRNHTVTARIDSLVPQADSKSLTKEIAEQSDIVIEFAQAQGIEDRIRLYIDYGIPAVIATTGWNEKLKTIEKMVAQSNIGIIYGSNFSVGVNVFFNIIREAVKFINNFPNYDIMAYEIHHNRKKDSPSGTARSISSIILENCGSKDTLITERLDRAVKKNELHFTSLRGGDVPGTHSVLFDSSADTIELKHTARNRRGFALGSVIASEWIIDKKGLFEFKDNFEKIIS